MFEIPQDLTFFVDGFYIDAMTARETPGFDPGGFYAFDLARGFVSTKHGHRVLVLESEIVGTLIALAVKHGDLTPVRALGKHIGEDISRSIGGDCRAATPEAVTTHAAALLSLLGWGSLDLERWGDALILTLDGAPQLDADQLGISALLGGLLTRLLGHDVACVPLREAGRFIVVHPTIAEQVFQWTKDGQGLGQIVGKLVAEEHA